MSKKYRPAIIHTTPTIRGNQCIRASCQVGMYTDDIVVGLFMNTFANAVRGKSFYANGDAHALARSHHRRIIPHGRDAREDIVGTRTVRDVIGEPESWPNNLQRLPTLEPIYPGHAGSTATGARAQKSATDSLSHAENRYDTTLRLATVSKIAAGYGPSANPSSARLMCGFGVNDDAARSLPLSERKYRSCSRPGTIQRDGPAIILPALLRNTIRLFNSTRTHSDPPGT
jgi:hypothetical protein